RLAFYRARLGGALMAHLDLRVALPALDERGAGPPGKSSDVVRRTVTAARTAQADRARHTAAATTNAALTPSDLYRLPAPHAAAVKHLSDATGRLGLTAADQARVLRVARTIADLAGSDEIQAYHMGEAVALAAPVKGTLPAAETIRY